MCTCKHTCMITHTLAHTYAHLTLKTYSHVYTRAEKQRWSVCDGRCFRSPTPLCTPLPPADAVPGAAVCMGRAKGCGFETCEGLDSQLCSDISSCANAAHHGQRQEAPTATDSLR